MNERIKELAQQAEGTKKHIPAVWQFYDRELEKFAELVVRECVNIVAKRKDQAIDDSWNVDEAMSMAEMDLLEHFGVDE